MPIHWAVASHHSALHHVTHHSAAHHSPVHHVLTGRTILRSLCTMAVLLRSRDLWAKRERCYKGDNCYSCCVFHFRSPFIEASTT